MHRIDKSKTGIAEVKVPARCREAKSEMNRAGNARLQVMLAHRRRNQQIDIAWLESGSGDRVRTGKCCCLNTSKRSKQARANANAFERRRKLFVNPSGSDDFWSLGMGNAPDGSSGER